MSTAIDRADIAGVIDRDPPRTFVDHRGRAESPGEHPELVDVNAEAAQQQRAVRFEKRFDIPGVDVENAGLTVRFDQSIGPSGFGRESKWHGAGT